MDNMSDSQFEFEDKYDDDFYDDVSADDNNQDDSGMEEKVVCHNSYDTDTDNETFKGKPTSLSTPNKSKKSNTKVNVKDKKSATRNSDPYKSYLTPTSRRAQSDPRGRKPKKGENMTSSGSKGISTRPVVNNSSPHNAVIKRVLSASRKKTSALHNVIYELQQNVEALTIANRDLKRNSRVQERDLRKLDSAEAQLPALMKKHSNEINVLQEKYKRQKEVCMNFSENLKKVDNELLRTKDKLKEYQTMVEEKNLPERIELKNNILNLEKVIEEKDNKISELNRSLSLQKKAHSRIIKEKNDKYEKAKEQVKLLEEVQKDLVQRLKEREKALEVTNIYSRRVPKDGKQMVMFSEDDPLAPILKKCQEESLQVLQTVDVKPKSVETKDEMMIVNSSVGNKVDTMVSRNDNEHEVQLNVLSPRIEQHHVTTTFVTEGKLKRESTEDFFDMNNGKENVKVTTKGRTSDGAMEVDSLGEEELHDKLDQMIEKRKEKDETCLDKGKVHTSIKTNVEDEESVQQLRLEKSVEQMSIVDKEGPNKTPELDDEAKRRKLLLARIQAIDNGENPEDITPASVERGKMNEKKSKPYKRPIFLESQKTSANTSDDDLSSVKSLDDYSNSTSKSNSANSKSRRFRPVPDSNPGSEVNSAERTKQRKDSWEFKDTDENLHKGLPSHADDITPTTNRTFPLQTRNNDRSLTGPLGHPNNTTVNGNKNRTNMNKSEWDGNAHSRHSTNYSPTVLDLNIGQNKRANKKNELNLFEQFEDPFKSTARNNIESESSSKVKNTPTGGNPSGKKLEDPGELFAKSNKVALTPDSTVVDDLEEMFIL